MRELVMVGMLALGGCHAASGRSIEKGTASDSKASLSFVESLARDLREMGGPYGSKSRPIQQAVADFDLLFESDDTLWAAALPVWSENARGVPAFVDSDRAAAHVIENFLANGFDVSP